MVQIHRGIICSYIILISKRIRVSNGFSCSILVCEYWCGLLTRSIIRHIRSYVARYILRLRFVKTNYDSFFFSCFPPPPIASVWRLDDIRPIRAAYVSASYAILHIIFQSSVFPDAKENKEKKYIFNSLYFRILHNVVIIIIIIFFPVPLCVNGSPRLFGLPPSTYYDFSFIITRIIQVFFNSLYDRHS